MIRVKMHEAKTNLSKLAAQAAAGEEVILMRGNVPIAKIVPLGATPEPRKPGRFKGVFELDDRFFDPLPEDELKLWEGG